MRKLATWLTAMLAFLVMPTLVLAQLCGDVNNHPPVDIGDLVQLADYLCFGPTLPNLAMADCDGRAGVTICDDAAIVKYLFDTGTLNCSPSEQYSSNYTVGDTIYWPYMLNIPDGIDAVDLPVTLRLQPNARGFYLPFLNQGGGANSVFRLQTVTRSTENILAFWSNRGDTAVLVTDWYDDTYYTGVNTIFTLHFVRNTSGIGNIIPQLVDRSLLWFPSLVRNNDMFRIAVLPTEQFLPPETLKATPASLAYASMAGKIAPDSFLVSFLSTGLPVSFNVTVSDPWIVLKDVPPGGFTTPATVWVRADATALGIGDYAGYINIAPVEPGTPVVPASVAVTFHVMPPVIYPPGDLNCDGICDLTDLSIMVLYLTGGGISLTQCNQL